MSVKRTAPCCDRVSAVFSIKTFGIPAVIVPWPCGAVFTVIRNPLYDWIMFSFQSRSLNLRFSWSVPRNERLWGNGIFLSPLIGFNETTNKPEMSQKKCSYWTNSCCHSDAIPTVMRSTRTGSLKSDWKNPFPQTLLFLGADEKDPAKSGGGPRIFELLRRGGLSEKWDNLKGFFFHFCPWKSGWVTQKNSLPVIWFSR